ncbi:glycosyltransferase [Candidatus Uabimicrobium sp. HlEnr_7]|uniref:glycosyltransferase n=1 Tax=Candidatus Uabimicrobium helgolandensis TaxID=3095367 RepID=UPI003556D7A2
MKKKSLRILHVSPSYYPAFSYGGPIHSVHLLNKNLVKLGVHVDVITSNAGLKDQDITLYKWQNIDNVRVMYCKYYGYHHFTFSPRMFYHLLRMVKNYDLIHITAVWNFPVVAASIACRVHNVPYVISPRGTIYAQTLLKKSRYIKKLYYHLIAKSCLNKSAALHFTTQDEQQKVQHFLRLKAKNFVIANGIDLKDFTTTNYDFSLNYLGDSSAKYILFLSRINWKKGLDLLLPAYAEFCKEHSQIFLVIAGPDENNYVQYLHELLDKHNIEKQVIFTGLITGEKKLAAYQQALCFVLPSYSENFGMVAIEALACNTPIIISNRVGIYLDIQQHNAGFICDINSPSVLQQLKVLWNNKELASQTATRGRNLVNNSYSAPAISSLMEQQYRKILCERK